MPKKAASTTDTVVFNGIRFNRYPNSKNKSDSRYYRPSAKHIRHGIGYLHHEIWKSAHGEIPAGHHIHHIDHNTLNNDIANLEAVEKRKHVSDHNIEHKNTVTESGKTIGEIHMESIRPLASEWHRSDAGREWHRRHGQNVFGSESRESVDRTCSNCGFKFTSTDFNKPGNSFCSGACKSAYRRKSGVDNVERECVVCGDKFTADKYSKQFTCSRKCGARARGDATLRKNGRL